MPGVMSKKRMIIYEELCEDKAIVLYVMQSSRTVEARIALTKLIGLIERLKKEV